MEPRTSRRLKGRRIMLRPKEERRRGWREKEVGGRAGARTNPEREKRDGEPDRGVDGGMKRWKRGRQLGPARTEQLFRPISSSKSPRHALA